MRLLVGWLRIPFFIVPLLLTGCVISENLYSGLSEREANQMVAILRYHEFNASKVSEGKDLFTVKIYEPQFSDAIQLLRSWGYPRSKTTDLGQLFSQSELVPTSTSEEARYIYGVAQELTKSISLLDGVVEVKVQLSLARISDPEKDDSGRNAASVFLLFDPGRFDPNAMTPQLRRMVASGLPDLTPADVTVLTQPVEILDFGEVKAVHDFGRLQFRDQDVRPALTFFAALVGLNLVLLFILIVVVVRSGHQVRK